MLQESEQQEVDAPQVRQEVPFDVESGCLGDELDELLCRKEATQPLVRVFTSCPNAEIRDTGLVA